MIFNPTTDSEVFIMDDNDYRERMLLSSLDEKAHDDSFSTVFSETTSSLMEEETLDEKDLLGSEYIGELDPMNDIPDNAISTTVKHETISDENEAAMKIEDHSVDPVTKKGIPGKFDVLCGQSRICASHAGNRRFQIVLDMFAPKYDIATSKQEKMALTKEIVSVISASGGRFLKYKDGSWQEIFTVIARDKVSHALRTKVASWKRQQERGGESSPAKGKPPTHRKRQSASSHRRRRSSSSSIATTASDIVTTSFDGNDPASKLLVEDLLKTQREIFANLQQGSDHSKEHPLKR